MVLPPKCVPLFPGMVTGLGLTVIAPALGTVFMGCRRSSKLGGIWIVLRNLSTVKRLYVWRFAKPKHRFEQANGDNKTSMLPA